MMTENDVKETIMKLLPNIGRWEVAFNEYTKAEFVIGYHYNSSTNKYEVYINNERGRQRIKMMTDNEIEALNKVLSLVEFEVESNRYV